MHSTDSHNHVGAVVLFLFIFLILAVCAGGHRYYRHHQHMNSAEATSTPKSVQETVPTHVQSAQEQPESVVIGRDDLYV